MSLNFDMLGLATRYLSQISQPYHQRSRVLPEGLSSSHTLTRLAAMAVDAQAS